jgi:hypothetical protein
VGEPVSAPRVRSWKLPIGIVRSILIDSWAQSAGCLVTNPAPGFWREMWPIRSEAILRASLPN